MTFRHYLTALLRQPEAFALNGLTEQDIESIAFHIEDLFPHHAKVGGQPGFFLSHMSAITFDTPLPQLIHTLSTNNYNAEVRRHINHVLSAFLPDTTILAGFPMQGDYLRYRVVIDHPDPEAVPVPDFCKQVVRMRVGAMFISTQNRHIPRIYDEFGQDLDPSPPQGISEEMQLVMSNRVLSHYRCKKLLHLHV